MPPLPLNSFFGMCNRINILLIYNCSSVYQEKRKAIQLSQRLLFIDLLDAKKKTFQFSRITSLETLSRHMSLPTIDTNIDILHNQCWFSLTKKKIKLRMTIDIRDIGCFGTWNSRTH